MKLRSSPNEGALPLKKVLRNLERRGVHVEHFRGTAYLLQNSLHIEIVYLSDPVEEATVHAIADRFGLRLTDLYFDKIEGDIH